mmetsp:Transcript_81251/g.230166  ORF Transcript_81251/g.230166 Transcript_81251/m.230166 type:complete len:201 (-) Transcript_81251:11-613(-)
MLLPLAGGGPVPRHLHGTPWRQPRRDVARRQRDEAHVHDGPQGDGPARGQARDRGWRLHHERPRERHAGHDARPWRPPAEDAGAPQRRRQQRSGHHLHGSLRAGCICHTGLRRGLGRAQRSAGRRACDREHAGADADRPAAGGRREVNGRDPLADASGGGPRQGLQRQHQLRRNLPVSGPQKANRLAWGRWPRCESASMS